MRRCCLLVFCSLIDENANKRIGMVDKNKSKTYSRRDSQMVTHSSTSRPVQCLCMAERTKYDLLTRKSDP
jgi:hypothetical protein